MSPRFRRSASRWLPRTRFSWQPRDFNRAVHSSRLRNKRRSTASSVPRYRLKSEQPSIDQSPIFGLGSDLMAHCMTFLEPLQVHSLLTVPLCKQWRDTYTVPQDVWRVLCLMEPFKAKFGPDDLDSEDDYDCSSESDSEMKNVFGKYRLLYTSFIRCLRYLTQIKDDAVHGRAAPSVMDYGGNDQNAYQLTSSSGLRSFLAKARVAVGNNKQRSLTAASDSNSPVGLSDDDRSIESEPMVSRFCRFVRLVSLLRQYSHEIIVPLCISFNRQRNPRQSLRQTPMAYGMVIRS